MFRSSTARLRLPSLEINSKNSESLTFQHNEAPRKFELSLKTFQSHLSQQFSKSVSGEALFVGGESAGLKELTESLN